MVILLKKRKIWKYVKTELIMGWIGNWPVKTAHILFEHFYWVYFGFIWKLNNNYRRKFMLAIFLVGLGVHYRTEHELQQNIYVSYFTELILDLFRNWPVPTSEILCLLFYKVDFEFIFLLKLVYLVYRGINVSFSQGGGRCTLSPLRLVGGPLLCLPKEVEPCAILPLGPLHTDPVRQHLGYSYAAVGGAHQSDCNPTIDVSARLRVGLFPLGGQTTG